MKGYELLVELALNVRFSWNHKGDFLWRTLEPDLWDRTQNPWVVLQTTSKEKLERLLQDPQFYQKAADLVAAERSHAEAKGWFQSQYPNPPLSHIAYFSMEYMLSEALPIYSGGLGNVAGDQLKAASDLGVPIVAVGLLFQQGYFRQVINKEGKQEAFFPFNSPSQLPITPVRNQSGEWVRIKFDFPGYPIWLRAWQVQVGRLKLYLLDSNDPENFPVHRGITGELYGGGPKLRLIQEIMLGVGGYRLLTMLGINPEVCHLNEGHAAFAIVERASTFMKETKQPFDVALTATRAGNLFTTHTAVAAAFDRFPPDLIAQYFSTYSEEHLGISLNELLALGRNNPNDQMEPFNMAYLAVRGSGAVNGVSKLHGTVSRHIFLPLFPQWPESDVPVGHVTNGVHMPSWDSKEADTVWTESCGKNRWLGSIDALGGHLCQVTDETLWQMRNSSRKELIIYTREQLQRQFAVIGEESDKIELAKTIFDPNTLTIGFARRFATYKRPDMLLTDPERLTKILTNRERPVQLIIAGKAHPNDLPGQELIQRWMEFIKRAEIEAHVIFLSDYDMLVSGQLVAGVDVWVNTPRRPWEACGTSGMKVLVNGGINLSELDGWWQEAYTPDVGWAIGDGKEHGDDPNWDAKEANTLYSILEEEVIPEFYTRDTTGIPKKWLEKMRASMSTLTPRFSANRAVCEYTKNYYIPGAVNFRNRAAELCAKSKEQLSWQRSIAEHWDKIRFVDAKSQPQEDQYLFEVQLYLDDLDPQHVEVQLYADGLDGAPPFCQAMTLVRQSAGSPGVYLYTASAPSSRPESHYTPRVIPHFPGASIPLEETHILWH